MQAEVVLRNCRVLNVVTGEIQEQEIEISNGRIQRLVGMGEGNGSRYIDCGGKFVSYGFADAHFHSESSMLSLPELTELLIMRGTSDIYINPHEVANVGGLSAVSEMLEEAEALPIDIHIIAPCKVPTAPNLETSGASFGLAELEEMLNWSSCTGIGELDAFKLLNRKSPYREFLEVAQSKGIAVCGSINGFSGIHLQDCINQGATDDHESTCGKEALEKLRAGCYIHVRESHAERNLTEIIRAVISKPMCYSRLMFCCDDRDAHELIEYGHIDDCIRKAIAVGLPPLQAYRLATLNVADYYCQRNRGLVAPGRYANLVMFSDLNLADISDVFYRGEQLVQNGKLLWRPTKTGKVPQNTICWPRRAVPEDLEHYVGKRKTATANIMKITSGQITTELLRHELPVNDGVVQADVKQDIQYFTLAERYRGQGVFVNGFVSGFGLQEGAFAASVAHDHHHLVCVGENHNDMAFALNHIAEIGGGLVVVRNGQVLAELHLPHWGLLSDLNARDTVKAIADLKDAARTLGCRVDSPFSILSLMCLPVLPECGFTDRGLVDVRAQKIIPVILDGGIE